MKVAEKICPILSVATLAPAKSGIVGVAGAQSRGGLAQACQGDKCALWIATNHEGVAGGACAIAMIPFGLQGVVQVMAAAAAGTVTAVPAVPPA